MLVMMFVFYMNDVTVIKTSQSSCLKVKEYYLNDSDVTIDCIKLIGNDYAQD